MLFKIHKVFDLKFELNLKNMFCFVQHYIYKQIEKELKTTNRMTEIFDLLSLWKNNLPVARSNHDVIKFTIAHTYTLYIHIYISISIKPHCFLRHFEIRKHNFWDTFLHFKIYAWLASSKNWKIKWKQLYSIDSNGCNILNYILFLIEFLRLK